MGEGKSVIDVEITEGFWLGETEVTQGQWQKPMGTTPWKGKENVREGDDYAASCISYDDAVAFVEKMTTQGHTSGNLLSGWKYALPTEAQWEYACRAGTTTKYSFGNSDSGLGEFGWFDENAADVGEGFAHQVGLKKPNAWGLRDMHGNVWEWCADWYDKNLQGGRDPVGPSTGSNRVFRGGSWYTVALGCRSAHHIGNSPVSHFDYVGFRLAVVPE